MLSSYYCQYWWALDVKLLELKLLETNLFEVKSLEVKSLEVKSLEVHQSKTILQFLRIEKECCRMWQLSFKRKQCDSFLWIESDCCKETFPSIAVFHLLSPWLLLVNHAIWLDGFLPFANTSYIVPWSFTTQSLDGIDSSVFGILRYFIGWMMLPLLPFIVRFCMRLANRR